MVAQKKSVARRAKQEVAAPEKELSPAKIAAMSRRYQNISTGGFISAVILVPLTSVLLPLAYVLSSWMYFVFAIFLLATIASIGANLWANHHYDKLEEVKLEEFLYWMRVVAKDDNVDHKIEQEDDVAVVLEDHHRGSLIGALSSK